MTSQPPHSVAHGTPARRVILVTGAASGIGAAICRAMAGPDTAILLHTRQNRHRAEAVAESVRSAGSLA